MDARTLTVAHQTLGECEYCDERHAAIVAAIAHELAEEIRREGGHKLCPHDCKNFDADLIDPEVSG